MDDINEISDINLKNIDINSLGISLNDIHIITPMKVGTTNFSNSLFEKLNVDHDPIKHNHNLPNLENFLRIKRNKLIITCFRNPLDRNISYFFDTFTKKRFPETYLCEKEDLYKYSLDEIINHFNKTKDKIEHWYKDWYECYFKITKIDKNSIKKSGVKLCKINKNSYVLLSTLEKYEDNIELLENFLTFKLNNFVNKTEYKNTKEIYHNFKRTIQIDNNYKDEVLNNNLTKNLYNEEEIKKFYTKYN